MIKRTHEFSYVEELYNIVGVSIRHIGLKYLHNIEFANDFVQDFWADIFPIADGFIVPINGHAYLCKVATNRAINMYKKRMKHEVKIVCVDYSEVSTSNYNIASFTESVRTGTLLVDGVVNFSSPKLEADDIKIKGVVKADGEISAENIYSEGCLKAREIYGERIEIKCATDKGRVYNGHKVNINFSLFGQHHEINSENISSVDNIEGTTVILESVRAKSVSGNNVTIGDDCDIDTVYSTGELTISPRAVVRNVERKQ